MWKKLKQGFNEWWEDTLNDYDELFSNVRRSRRAKSRARSLRRAIRLAEKKHEADNKRYYVVLDWTGRRYEVINNNDIAFRKRTGSIRKGTTFADILRVSAYVTKSGKI